MNESQVFKFRLYTAGDAPNSLQAVANLKSFCQEFLPGRHEIEVIDVMANPKRALADNVLMTPMLVRISPPPALKIIGNLCDPKPLERLLDGGP